MNCRARSASSRGKSYRSNGTSTVHTQIACTVLGTTADRIELTGPARKVFEGEFADDFRRDGEPEFPKKS